MIVAQGRPRVWTETKNCQNCDTEFRITNNQTVYCCQKCYFDYKSKNKKTIEYKRDWNRKYFQENKELINNRRRNWRQKRRNMFNDYKSNIGCFRCGEQHPACLEFHHLDPSEKDISIRTMVRLKGENLSKELDKCILVCANCHREIHNP